MDPNLPVDPNALVYAVQHHLWAVVAGIIITIAVWAMRLEALKPQLARIPERYRALVPIVLGVLSGVAEALTTRQPWVPALIASVMAALPAFFFALRSPLLDATPSPPITVSEPKIVVKEEKSP